MPSYAKNQIVPNHHDLQWWTRDLSPVAFLLRGVAALMKSMHSSSKHRN